MDANCDKDTTGGCTDGVMPASLGGSTTSILLGIDVFLFICCRWIQGVGWSVLGAIGLSEDATLL